MPIQPNCACPPETEISLLRKINNNIAITNQTAGGSGTLPNCDCPPDTAITVLSKINYNLAILNRTLGG